MRLVIKILLGVVLLLFVVIQFFQPEKNESEDTQNHIFQKEQVPENVQLLLKNACMDCHSNQTTYLWYHKISPVSWLVNKHVIDGKDELNFSEWGSMDAYDKIGAFEDIVQEIERKTMPIKQYTLMHSNAKLSELQRAIIVAWGKKRSEELSVKLNEE